MFLNTVRFADGAAVAKERLVGPSRQKRQAQGSIKAFGASPAQQASFNRNMAMACITGCVPFNFFSNISIAVRSFVPSSNAVDFCRRLAGAGLIVDIEGIDELAMAMRENAPAFELLCQLNVTFFHDEPDVRRTIPSVPG